MGSSASGYTSRTGRRTRLGAALIDAVSGKERRLPFGETFAARGVYLTLPGRWRRCSSA